MFNIVNNQFQQFYDFAQARKLEGNNTAIAKLGDDVPVNPLDERSIVVKTGDFIGKFRSQASEDVNNAVRDLFKRTVIDMFGGERYIPDSVKDAMLMKDYGKGKPLTARRINAVATAIKKLGMENAFEAKGAVPGELVRRALDAGFESKDFAKLSLAANLYVKAFGGSLKDAILIVLDPSSGIGDAAVADELNMKDAKSFADSFRANGFACDRTLVHTANMNLADSAAVRRDIKCFASIARNNAAYLRGMINEPAEKLQDIPGFKPANDPLANLRQTLATVADGYDQIAQQIERGKLTDESQALKQVLNNDDLTSQISNAIMDSVRALKQSAVGDLKQPLDEVVEMLVKLNRTFTSSRNECVIVFKASYAKRETPTALAKLYDALRVSAGKGKQPHALPKSFANGLEKYISGFAQEEVAKIGNLCKAIKKGGTDNLFFNESQRVRFKELLVNVLGNEKAEKALPGLIDQIEGALLAECLKSDLPPEEMLARPRAETVLAHFENHPQVLTAMNVGFNMGDPAKVKAAIMDEMKAELQNSLNKTSGVTSFVSGMMPQAVREYVKGYVTFNGENIHTANTDKKFFPEASSEDRRGYAEFLEEKFPESKIKMRQTVSYLCGMALGIAGSIETLLREGKEGDDNLLLGFPRNDGKDKYKTHVLSRNNHPRENYDITMDDNGDVTIKLTHYAVTTVNSITSDSGKDQKLILLDGQQAKIGMSKMVVTVKITNASDADLPGNKMPEFEIADFTQEQMDIE